MFKIAEKTGRQEAHEIVYKVCMEAVENNISLEETLFKGMHTNFKFSKVPKYGYINTELMMLRFKNFELQQEK
jgi:hypothetical protein